MHKNVLSRVLVAGAALAIVAGCSGNSGSLAPGQSSSLTPSRQVPGMRWLPGPVVAGPVLAPLMVRHDHLVRGWPDSRKRRREHLFVADETGNVIEIYNPREANPSPEGSITDGLNAPIQIAFDTLGTLYVANIGNNTITEYPKHSTSPSKTLSTGLTGPYGVAVDSKGDVFASNLNNNTIVEFPAGATTPSQTISFSAYGQAVGIGVDGNDNVWVACDSSNAVYEIPAGSSTPVNAGLTGLEGPIDISFGKADQMFVSNFSAPNVQVYTYGTTSPAYTITNGMIGPTLNGVTYTGAFFQSNQSDNVVGYKRGATSPFSTITGIGDPAGIAAWPLVQK